MEQEAPPFVPKKGQSSLQSAISTLATEPYPRHCFLKKNIIGNRASPSLAHKPAENCDLKLDDRLLIAGYFLLANRIASIMQPVALDMAGLRSST